jgi:hypothetical protein
MNPLGIPRWSKDKKSGGKRYTPPSFENVNVVTGEPEDRPARAPVPQLTKAEEFSRLAARAEHSIEIRVAGEGTLPAQTVRMPWVRGYNLGQYLEPLGLKHTATRRAVYDLTNLSKGRLRLYYEPAPNAIISIRHRDDGPMRHRQTNQGADVEAIAFNMGAKKGQEPPKFVDYDMRYGPRPASKPKTQANKDEHDIDQI